LGKLRKITMIILGFLLGTGLGTLAVYCVGFIAQGGLG